jgi:hypothetical protein
VRAPVLRDNGDELGRANNVDAAVVAVVEAQDRVAAYQPVLDDPVEIAADEFVGPARPHPRRNPDLTAGGAGSDPGRKGVYVAAAERDLRQMQSRHCLAMPD